MGFGILFIGYLIGINTVAYPGFTKILSFLVMLLAMAKLSPYNPPLKKAYYTLIPTTVFGALYFMLEIAGMFFLLPQAEILLFRRIAAFAVAICEVIFLLFLLRGLQALAKETAVPFLEVNSFRNRIFTVVYYLFYLIGQLDFPASMIPFLRYYTLAVLIVGLAVMFLNAKLIYGFYMWICLPGDEDMKRKTSSIPFLDKLYAKMDDAEERRLTARREADAAYRAEKKKKKEKKKKR